MVSRPFWLNRIVTCWSKAPIVWLSGVRRVGKTIAAEVADADFLNCDLRSSQQILADPEAFYRSLTKPRLIYSCPADAAWCMPSSANGTRPGSIPGT
jgi:predicted AAA+ superfamily ATPase